MVRIVKEQDNKNRCICPYTDCCHNKGKCALPTQNRFVKPTSVTHIGPAIGKTMGALLQCTDYATKRCARCGIVVGETYIETELVGTVCRTCSQIPPTKGHVVYPVSRAK